MLAIFAEGTTTNGTCLLPFKRGAFEGMRPVVPSYVSYETGPVLPFYDSISIFRLSVMIFASLQWNTLTLNIMPVFRPNKTMLKQHKDKGKCEWEIFAACVRDAISKKSGLP